MAVMRLSIFLYAMASLSLGVAGENDLVTVPMDNSEEKAKVEPVAQPAGGNDEVLTSEILENHSMDALLVEEDEAKKMSHPKTPKEMALEEMSSHQVLCQGCVDKYIGNLMNALKEPLKSTGNRLDLESLYSQKIIHDQLKKDLTDLAEKILETENPDPTDKEKLSELLKITQALSLKPMMKKIHELKGKGSLTSVEAEELKVMSDRLAAFTKDHPFQKLWKKSIDKFDDRTMGREVRKLSLIAEYYSKYIKAPKKRYTSLRIQVEGHSVSNTDHSLDGVNKYLFGDADSRTNVRREGAIGQFEEEAERLAKKKEMLERQLEKREEEKERLEERKERIEAGEILSTELIQKAKYHHNRYKFFYSQMETKCRMSIFNRRGCERATYEFKRFGKGLHLKKMFDLIQMANKDREMEVIAHARNLRKQYLEDEGLTSESSERDYSLFDSRDEYGEFADGFGRSENFSYEENFPMGNFGHGQGRTPSGIMGGPSSFPQHNMGMGGTDFRLGNGLDF